MASYNGCKLFQIDSKKSKVQSKHSQCKQYFRAFTVDNSQTNYRQFFSKNKWKTYCRNIQRKQMKASNRRTDKRNKHL